MPGRQFSSYINNPQAIDALHDGVPEWMRSSLDEWLRNQLVDRSYSSRSFADITLMHRLERLLRISLGSSDPASALISIFHVMNRNEDVKLDVVDALLQLKGNPYSGTSTLEVLLQESGSKWKVVRNETTGVYSLQERVDGTVAQAVVEVASQGGDASEYLTKAWNDMFGRNPNPSAAYGNIIKAVEAASWQVVTPTNSRATLGTIIRKLIDHPENFAVAITEKSAHTGIESIRQQMTLIWEGQTDRHGTSSPIAPTQEAAEQAIFIGLSLCQQFIRGHIAHI